ncbi:hypothetical protein AB0395_30770 [Streptosporangium sp. NPDC051023]|uniref:hypothetical protein n=1 Tax=Streptosporangium sp. NPDC051023 TaxID=3155410 RepID=UPI00344CFA8A
MVAVIIMAAVTSCSSTSPTSPDAAVAALLKRPLNGPSVTPGAGCPVTRTTTRPTTLSGDLLGDGPARPSMKSVLRYTGEEPGTLFANSGWAGEKVLWFTAPDLSGPVVIRGVRLDGSTPVAFDGTEGQSLESKIVVLPERNAGDWRDRPSYVRLKAPGCYAFQVDTLAGSSFVVFQALGPVVT